MNKRTIFMVKQLAVLCLVIIMVSCAHHHHEQNQQTAKRIEGMWNPVNGQFCKVDLDEEIAQLNNPVLSFARTENGEMAVCLSDGIQEEPYLVAIAGHDFCKSIVGKSKPEKKYTAFVLVLQNRKGLTYRTIKNGSFDCIDKYQLLSGGELKLFGYSNEQFKDDVIPVIMSDQFGVIMKVADKRSKGVEKSLGLDFEYELGPGIRDVVYGMEEVDGVIQEDVFAIYNEDVSPPALLARFVVAGPGFDIGIVGNDQPNQIRRTARAINCEDGNRLHPCNPDWDFNDFWLVGMGRSDRLLGIDDPDTRNVLFGDFGCGSPPAGGTGGKDVLTGGPGNDYLVGEEGDDFIYGGDGNDKIYGNLSHCGFSGGSDSDHIFGDAGHDLIYGDSPFIDDEGDADYILGGGGNDTIMAGPGNDDIYGDTYSWGSVGWWGNDKICGGPGRDFINGGLGVDEIFIDEDDIIEVHPDEAADRDLITTHTCLSYFYED